MGMFDLTTFRKAVKRGSRNWATTDAILYRLCREMPKHSDPGKTRAKLLIIGRSYATGIERAIPSDGKQGSAIEQLADHLCRNAKRIDEQLGRLRRLDGSRVEHFRRAVDVHGKIVRILGKICVRSPRSFVSKYLHFHFPIVPIYDRYARRAITSAVPWTEEVNAVFVPPRTADAEYCRFSKRFWVLYQEAQRVKGHIRVKELDRYLCYLVDSEQ